MRKKRNDRNGRYRNKTVCFRLSEKENDLLNRKSKMLGLSKQDYIINCILDKEIVVEGNSYIYQSLHEELERFVELYGKQDCQDDQELRRWILKFMKQLDENKKTNIKADNKEHRHEPR